MKSALPFSKITIEKLTDIHPTPFYIYDEKGIREGAKFLKEAFANVGLKHKNFFAVKALPET
jgi:diaminopimelate decarboxylase